MDNNNPILKVSKRLPSLFFGFILYAVGILSSYYAELGMTPWGVFHVGITKHTALTLGQASQVTGIFILVIAYMIGVIPGLGSIFNMYFIGIFVDILNKLGIFKTPETLLEKFLLLIFSIFIIGWASFFYLRANLGAGPRDGLMEGLVKKFDKPVWMIRSFIEITVLIIGYILEGPVGAGTLITAFTVGFSIQLAFKIGKYSSKGVEHINIVNLYKSVNEYYKLRNSEENKANPM